MAPQTFELARRELEHKINSEALDIAPYSPVKGFCFHLIQFRQVRIQYDLLPANQQDSPFNAFRRDRQT
jgi:hypothetical protein